MARLSLIGAILGLASSALAQCGSGTPDAIVDGVEGAYTATAGGAEVYAGDNYLVAITSALGSVTAGQRVSVVASGNIGPSSVFIGSGITFEGCGTINADIASGKGAIESTDTQDVSIPYLSLTGSVYFGMRFFGTSGLNLGDINMDLTAGLGIRFERDEAPNTDVTMGTVTVTGATSHAVECWNIDGLEIGAVIARDVGECGLLLQTTTNAHVGLVDAENVATGTGYAALRFANRNGMLPDGRYDQNVLIDRVVAVGGGRGIFCVSESGGATVSEYDLTDNENNSILVENCYGVVLTGGSVNGGGEIRISARDEFPNTRDVYIGAEANGVSVRESPCGENITWEITGDASLEIC